MEIGVTIHATDKAMNPIELAVCAEERGFYSLYLPEHTHIPTSRLTPWPGGAELPRDYWHTHDPFVALSAMAAVTERINFITSIFVLTLRHPVMAAKTIATTSVLSGGRLKLGVGAGWMREEFDLLGQPFERRGRRLSESIDVMRKLWRGGMVEHHGEFYDFDELQMSPAPTARIPLIGGGLSKPALRRVGRLLDGWISDIHTADELAEIIARIRAFRAEYGRADEPLDIIAACSDASGVDGYRRLEELGVTHIQTMPWMFYGGGDSASLREKVEGLKRFASDVIEPMSRG